MEKLIQGLAVKDSKSGSGSSSFCDFSVVVKKGHEECGDSAFAYCDEKKAVFGIFDGVSGEADAAAASSQAAAAILDHLKKIERCDEKKMQEAISKAQLSIQNGYTTALILFVERAGSFVIASAGDSPAYGINAKGEIALELPLARAVGDGDSIFKFLHFRNIVTSVLGPGGGEAHVHIRRGKLSKNEIFILASDGLSDNLWLKVENGFVVDSSGSHDLKKLTGKERNPGKIMKKLEKEIQKRIRAGRKESKDALLAPKQDDIAIAVFRFK